VNPFTHISAAQRYATWRPYFHPEVIGRIKEVLELREPMARVLDVGCGTGQSCYALLPIARVVFATDISREMLSERIVDSRIHYAEAAAEMLPFPGERFDAITVSAAFHWFEQGAFLREARRLLAASGWLIVYNNYFAADMEGNANFHAWFSERYLKRYPSPPRRATTLREEDAENFGFVCKQKQQYANRFHFSPETLALYLTTQSNIVQATESGTETLEEVLTWLHDELTPFFSAESAAFEFSGPISFLQKTARAV
jgi:ubiquinone/menaquinone biosynthesis C-methylase UbiE